jgi:hypothetical protein
MFHLGLNFYKWLSARNDVLIDILLLGIDGAGKTTLGHSLQGTIPPETMGK